MSRSKKRIGLLHYTAPPVIGGVESVLAHHARLLNESGHSVRIIAGRGGEHFSKIQFSFLPLADSLHPQILDVKAQLDEGKVPVEFEQLVQRIQADLAIAVRGLDQLIAHNVCSLHKNLALTVALRRVCSQPGAPHLIMWHHDLAWTTPRYQPELYDSWPWNIIREEWSEVKPTLVVVSDLRRQELSNLYNISPGDIEVVPSGLDTENFLKLDPLTSKLIQHLQLLKANPRLILPVRITRRKNIELAIRAVSAMCLQMPQTNLIITGPPGPHNPTNQIYFDELRQLRTDLGINNQVHFMAEMVSEYLPDVVIADLYRVVDALIFPSREEGFGIPMLEAGLVGLPIFCANIPPLHDIAGPYATYFPPDIDPFDLAKLITFKLQNNDIYQLRQRVRQHYTWSGVFKHKIEPLLDSH